MNNGVLITGAAKRIGKQIAVYFASKGYNIAIHYHNSDKEAIMTKHEIEQKHNVYCEIFKADFRNKTQTINLISKVQEKIKLEYLINNASMFHENSFSDEGSSNLDVFTEINFKAPYLLTKQFSKVVQKGGIINILDTKITQNHTKHFDYLLSKKFLEAFTKQVAYELAHEIRVNGIAPGIILPPIDKGADYINDLASKIPMKSSGNTYNITQAIDFLITNNYVTGQIIFIDGGENL
jgi:pteridine reductase